MQQPESTAAVGGIDTAGPDGAPTIVFIHGAIFTRTLWAPQRDALAEAFHLVAPDLPGHGTLADREFDFEAALDGVDRVIETETDRSPLVVGLSLGGYLATEYARRKPDRVGGLVLSGCSANPVGTLKRVTQFTGAVSRLATRSDRIERFVESRAADWVRNRNLTKSHTAEIIEAGFYPRSFGVAGRYLEGHDFRAALSTYPGPTLICNGENDLVMKRGQAAHAEAAQDARIETVSDAGHVVNLHRPEAYSSLVGAFAHETLGLET